MIVEGYIKFSYNLIKGASFLTKDIEDINYYRNQFLHKGYIGMKDGIGFGNISIRLDNSSFIITASKTGGLQELKSKHYAKVISWDFVKNHIEAISELAPSSESLTHAIFYELDKDIKVVIHIHCSFLWGKYINKLPTISEKAKFGSVEMVNEIRFMYNNSNLKEKGILITAGHKNGIFVFGQSFKNVLKSIMNLELEINKEN